MTDRELLESAAKAAGMDTLIWHDEMQSYWIQYDAPQYWNPLTDDGDALRLAVKLEIDIEYANDTVTAWFVAARPGWDNGCVTTAEEPYGCDKAAATRRAIVRAAAEIGKRVP